MKYLLIVLILFIGTGAFASDQLSNSLNQTDTSIAISHFDLGKNKKSRKGKRANKKRKRRCHRAARRNFAG